MDVRSPGYFKQVLPGCLSLGSMRFLLLRLLLFGISIIHLQNKSGNTLITLWVVRTFKSILITSNERYKYEIMIVYIWDEVLSILFHSYDLCALLMQRDNIHFDLQKKNQLFSYLRIELLCSYYYDTVLATSMQNENCLLKKALPKNDMLGDGLVIISPRRWLSWCNYILTGCNHTDSSV